MVKKLKMFVSEICRVVDLINLICSSPTDPSMLLCSGEVTWIALALRLPEHGLTPFWWDELLFTTSELLHSL